MACIYLSPILFFFFTKHAIIGYVFWRFNVSKLTLWGLGNMTNQMEWDYLFLMEKRQKKDSSNHGNELSRVDVYQIWDNALESSSWKLSCLNIQLNAWKSFIYPPEVSYHTQC